jgi:hypothetical protein
MPEGGGTQLPSTLPMRSAQPKLPAEPVEPILGTQSVTGSKRNRDGESGIAEPRKKRHSEPVPDGKARAPAGHFNPTQG